MNENVSTYDFAGKTFYFGVKTTYGIEQEKSVNYIATCTYNEFTEQQFLVKINRKKFFINGVEPKKVADQLADACMKVLYPIECLVTRKGEFISFYGFEALRKRWQQGIPKIRQEYKGDQVNAYLAQMAVNLESKEQFSEALKNDFLYSLLFMGLFLSKEEMVISFPTDPFKPLNKFYGTCSNLERKAQMAGVYFKGEDDQKNTLEVSKWHYSNDASLAQIKASYKCVSTQNNVNYTLIRLKEREDGNSNFYLEPKEEEIEVKVKKKKKKWWLF